MPVSTPADAEACETNVLHPAAVAMARGAMPPAELIGGASELLKAVADPTRMRILVALQAAGELCVCDLSAVLGMSDSASLDNVLEYFVMAGMSLPHALAMLVPESFNDRNPISPGLKAFYEYHS
ncbi:ArsR family transcriptional regulator, partial [uncultured Meiothermus sp.]|uniref:ArsR family transcriptional regulator n=1 Tax=uncultured Meiothermus sp. TaxID=157471 RepID=UPI00261DC4CF